MNFPCDDQAIPTSLSAGQSRWKEFLWLFFHLFVLVKFFTPSFAVSLHLSVLYSPGTFVIRNSGKWSSLGRDSQPFSWSLINANARDHLHKSLTCKSWWQRILKGNDRLSSKIDICLLSQPATMKVTYVASVVLLHVLLPIQISNFYSLSTFLCVLLLFIAAA